MCLVVVVLTSAQAPAGVPGSLIKNNTRQPFDTPRVAAKSIALDRLHVRCGTPP